jgi:hypothetical protein
MRRAIEMAGLKFREVVYEFWTGERAGRSWASGHPGTLDLEQ